MGLLTIGFLFSFTIMGNLLLKCHVWESESFSLLGSFFVPFGFEIPPFTEPGHRKACCVSHFLYRLSSVQGPGVICITGSSTIGTFMCDSSGRNGSSIKMRRCWDRTADHSFTPTGPSPQHTQYDENNYRELLYKKSQMFSSSSSSLSSIQSKATI